VIPCYNTGNLRQTEQFSDFLVEGHGVPVIFANDGSGDPTLQLPEYLREKFGSAVTILDKPINESERAAIRDGDMEAIKSAMRNISGFRDDDSATPRNAIRQIPSETSRNQGSAHRRGGAYSVAWTCLARDPLRHYRGRLFTTVISIMLRLLYTTRSTVSGCSGLRQQSKTCSRKHSFPGGSLISKSLRALSATKKRAKGGPSMNSLWNAGTMSVAHRFVW
jgi:hypothetical protein